MKYQGGKEKYGSKIAAVLENERISGAPFFDVFAGGISITCRVSGNRFANDICRPLIQMYKSYQSGWRPPDEISETEYYELKSRMDLDNPLTAFAGFGLSYSGKFFGGYARAWRRPGTRTQVSKSTPGAIPINMTKVAARGLAKKMSSCLNVKFSCLDFGDLEIPKGSLVYLDPPYKNTLPYAGAPPFEDERFNDWALSLAAESTVVLSEYDAPPGPWIEIWSRTSSKTMDKKPRTEKLFMVKR